MANKYAVSIEGSLVTYAKNGTPKHSLCPVFYASVAYSLLARNRSKPFKKFTFLLPKMKVIFGVDDRFVFIA